MHLIEAPSRLKEIQTWFANVIAKPLNADNTSQATPFFEKASQFVTPNEFLQPQERIQIYNQQYWWRLYSVLQDTYPSVLRLYGYTDFNAFLVIPYLTAYPSNHWSLNKLGDRMLKWTKKHYNESDKGLIFQTMKLDHAFHYAFCSKKGPVINHNVDIATAKLKLQPHATLLKCDGPFYEFRKALLEHPVEHWQENDFPPIPKDGSHYYLVYRTPGLFVTFKELSLNEYKILKCFKKGCTLEEACSSIEGETDGVEIQKWFQEWTQEEILSYASKK